MSLISRKQAEAQISVYQKQIDDAENPLSAVQAQKASLEQVGIPIYQTCSRG